MPKKRSLYNDKVLFDAISQGDSRAFKQLFDRYKNRLFAAALKLTKSEAAAEDIIQDVFLSLWENSSRLKEIKNPEAYIFTIAYHTTFRYLKRVSKDAQLYQILRLQLRHYAPSIDDFMNVKDTQEIVSQVIESLPSKRRLIYKLSREEGFSHKDIAEKLSISPLTVKKQIVLALKEIKNSLRKAAVPISILLFIGVLVRLLFFLLPF